MRSRDVAALVGAAIIALLLLGLLGGGMMMGPGMMGGYWGWGYGNSWWGIAMMLFWVLVLGGGLWFLVSLFRRSDQVDTGLGTGRSTPLDILKERYAGGEITREQYQEMKRDLDAG